VQNLGITFDGTTFPNKPLFIPQLLSKTTEKS